VGQVSERTSWADSSGDRHIVAVRWQVLLQSLGSNNLRGFLQWPTQFANTKCQPWHGAKIVLSHRASQVGFSSIWSLRMVDCSHGPSGPESKRARRATGPFLGLCWRSTPHFLCGLGWGNKKPIQYQEDRKQTLYLNAKNAKECQNHVLKIPQYM
jgi:hypothetical protein